MAHPGLLSPEAAIAFVSFVLSDAAQRASVRGRRQKRPLKGRQVSYGVKVALRRGSDQSERVYVSVTALQLAGWNNYAACCEVAGKWESRLGQSRRGRSRTDGRARELGDKVEIVRTTYNRFKLRHPWKEKLPERDLVYELWYAQFQLFQQWVGSMILLAIQRGLSGEHFAEELTDLRGTGGRLNYQALASLGRDGLEACLISWRSKQPVRTLSVKRIRNFVKAFFQRAQTVMQLD